MSRKRLALAATGLALAVGLVAPSAAIAAPVVGQVQATANKCSSWKEIHIKGGAAKYMECTKKVNGKSYASGAFYLWDTKHDGKAVQAYAETDYNHWYGDDVTWEHFYGWGNEKHGSPKYISGWHRGNDFGLRIFLR